MKGRANINLGAKTISTTGGSAIMMAKSNSQASASCSTPGGSTAHHGFATVSEAGSSNKSAVGRADQARLTQAKSQYFARLTTPKGSQAKQIQLQPAERSSGRPSSDKKHIKVLSSNNLKPKSGQKITFPKKGKLKTTTGLQERLRTSKGSQDLSSNAARSSVSSGVSKRCGSALTDNLPSGVTEQGQPLRGIRTVEKSSVAAGVPSMTSTQQLFSASLAKERQLTSPDTLAKAGYGEVGDGGGEGGETETCVNSDAVNTKTTTSIQQRLNLRNQVSSKITSTKVQSTANLFTLSEDIGGGESLVRGSGNEIHAEGLSPHQSQCNPQTQPAGYKKLKAHRAKAVNGTQHQNAALIGLGSTAFQDKSAAQLQSRAAQRYASVDKEEFESHISLSSFRSAEGGSHRKNKASPGLALHFLNASNAKQKAASRRQQLAAAQGALRSHQRIHESNQVLLAVPQQTTTGKYTQQNNYMNTEEKKKASNTCNHFFATSSPRALQIDEQAYQNQSVKGAAETLNFYPSQQETERAGTYRQIQIEQVASSGNQDSPVLALTTMHKIQSMGDLYSCLTGQNPNAKTAVAMNEKLEQMHAGNISDFYQTLTPKDPLEKQNSLSLSPKSKTTSSYRDSESLGFALSERQKAHQLKQLKIKQRQLQTLLEVKGHAIDHQRLLELASENQQLVQEAIQKVQMQGASVSPDMASGPGETGTNPSVGDPSSTLRDRAEQRVLYQVSQQALLHQQQLLQREPDDFRQAAARTLHRLQLEQRSGVGLEFGDRSFKAGLVAEPNTASSQQHASSITPKMTPQGSLQMRLSSSKRLHSDGMMIAIQEQQDSEDRGTQLRVSQQEATYLSVEEPQADETAQRETFASPLKINASRSKRKKKTIDQEVIKYFKRMVKNQQMDKFKEQMNSQSNHLLSLQEERNLSPKITQHRNGLREHQKKPKVMRDTTGESSSLLPLQSKTSQPVAGIQESKTLETYATSQEFLLSYQPPKQQALTRASKKVRPRAEVPPYFTSTQDPSSLQTFSTHSRVSSTGKLLEQEEAGQRLRVPRLPIEQMLQSSCKTIANPKEGEDPVINIVTGGSFGRQEATAQQIVMSPTTQPRASNRSKPQPPASTTEPKKTQSEEREFQRTLKKAIVSLQQLQQATKSTTGETPYNTTSVRSHKPSKAKTASAAPAASQTSGPYSQGRNSHQTRQERNLSGSSYTTAQPAQKRQKGKFSHPPNQRVLANLCYPCPGTDHKSLKSDHSSHNGGAATNALCNAYQTDYPPSYTKTTKQAQSVDHLAEQRHKIIVTSSDHANEPASGVHYRKNSTASSIENTASQSSLIKPSTVDLQAAHLRKLINQESGGNLDSGISNPSILLQANMVAASFARDGVTFETFGRPSAMSYEKLRESTYTSQLEGSPFKDASDRMDTQVYEQVSLRKNGSVKKKKLKQTIPKPETAKRPRKHAQGVSAYSLKTKKRQSESSKILSLGAGSHTANGSLTGSKRCSTSHFGHHKSQQSSAAASKESSKRQSVVSSLSKRSQSNLKEEGFPMQQTVHKVTHSTLQQALTGTLTTPIIKKHQIRKAGGSGQNLESRKYNSIMTGSTIKETCTRNADLKKKLASISGGDGNARDLLEATAPQGQLSKAVQAANQLSQLTKKRRASQADQSTTRRNQQAHRSKPNQSQPTLDMFTSVKTTKKLKQVQAYASGRGQQSNNQLGQLYNQLNTLLSRREGTSAIGPASSNRERKSKAQAQQSIGQAYETRGGLPSSASQPIMVAGLQQPKEASANQLLTRKADVVTSQRQSHARKKSEALKKSNSSQQLLDLNKLHYQANAASNLQLKEATQTVQANAQAKRKAAIFTEASSRKVDLMSPLAKMFNTSHGKQQQPANETTAGQGRASGKSRNVSDQNYHQSDNFEYSQTGGSQMHGKVLYKTSGPLVGVSRNAKQQFSSTLGAGQPHSQSKDAMQPAHNQYSSQGSMVRRPRATGSMIQLNHQMVLGLDGNGPGQQALTMTLGSMEHNTQQKRSFAHVSQGDVRQTKSLKKNAMLSSTQPHLGEKPAKNSASLAQTNSGKASRKAQVVSVKRHESMGSHHGVGRTSTAAPSGAGGYPTSGKTTTQALKQKIVAALYQKI